MQLSDGDGDVALTKSKEKQYDEDLHLAPFLQPGANYDYELSTLLNVCDENMPLGQQPREVLSSAYSSRVRQAVGESRRSI